MNSRALPQLPPRTFRRNLLNFRVHAPTGLSDAAVNWKKQPGRRLRSFHPDPLVELFSYDSLSLSRSLSVDREKDTEDFPGIVEDRSNGAESEKRVPE